VLAGLRPGSHSTRGAGAPLAHGKPRDSSSQHPEANALSERSESKGFRLLPSSLLLCAMPFYVYILRMSDGRLYVGHSNNPPRRLAEHEQGKGCRTTGIFGAGDIVFVEEHPDRVSAARRERQMKGWTRAKKLALAAGNLSELHELAKRRA